MLDSVTGQVPSYVHSYDESLGPETRADKPLSAKTPVFVLTGA